MGQLPKFNTENEDPGIKSLNHQVISINLEPANAYIDEKCSQVSKLLYYNFLIVLFFRKNLDFG